MTSLGHVIMWKDKHEKGNKHKSCEHREHGGHDQSQMKNKSLKKFEKYELSLKMLPNDKNNDTIEDRTGTQTSS